MTNDEEFLRERISAVIQENGKSKKIAELTGIPVGTLNKYVARTSTPSAINAVKIARAVKLQLEDILQSEISKYGIDEADDQLISIPVYDITASAGFGDVVPAHEAPSASLPVI